MLLKVIAFRGSASSVPEPPDFDLSRLQIHRVENQNRTFNQAANSRSFSENPSGVRKGSENLGSF
jgi:hypothetical protein